MLLSKMHSSGTLDVFCPDRGSLIKATGAALGESGAATRGRLSNWKMFVPSFVVGRLNLWHDRIRSQYRFHYPLTHSIASRSMELKGRYAGGSRK